MAAIFNFNFKMGAMIIIEQSERIRLGSIKYIIYIVNIIILIVNVFD